MGVTVGLIHQRLYENRILSKKIIGPKSEELTGGWRKLHIEGLHSLLSSPNMTRLIRSKSMKWV
jgi:hypothetical protein